jgi:hypothetical protein
MADLLLGRRQQPDLDVVDATATVSFAGPPAEARLMTLKIQVTVENRGITRADGVAAGMLGWTIAEDHAQIGARVLNYLDVVEPAPEWKPRRLGHIRLPRGETGGHSIPSLYLSRIGGTFEFKAPWIDRTYRCRMALYFVAEQLPPTWYQLDCEIPHHSAVLPMRPPPQLMLKVQRLVGSRPIVAWEGL